MSEWKKVKLGEILNFKRGYDLPKTEMISGAYPVVGSNGIIGYHNTFNTSPCLTIGRSGNVGTPHYFNGKAWAHNTTLYVEDYKNNYPKFLFYFLKTLNLENYRSGSAVPTLNRNHIHILNVSIPCNYIEQKAIADVLASLDDKIELNNKINKNLEEQAQALFKRWFVDFDFPDENGNPYKSSGGEMKDSELGFIPKDWEVSTFQKDLVVKYGKNLPTNQLNWSSQYPVFGGNGIIGYYNKFIYDKPQVLIACRGAASGKVVISVEKSFITNNSLILELKDNLNFDFLKFFCLQSDFSSYVTGSAQPQITIENLNKKLILVPCFKILEKFRDLVCNMNFNIFALEKQNQKLAELRDYLLPKLMSGEIRVNY